MGLIIIKLFKFSCKPVKKQRQKKIKFNKQFVFIETYKLTYFVFG